ncbi:MAG: ribosome maturation factor RimP, partial [candidate division NC10 bacterium]
RPLRKAADFARFAGQRVDVRRRLPDATGRRRFTGLLKGFGDNAATLDVDGQAVTLSLDEIERARLVPDLQARKESR